jgi:mannosyltransferase
MKRLLLLAQHLDLALLGILALALAVRLAGLTFHSLWLDEAVSVNWARLPAAELVARTITLREDSHPPLYYLALHGWIGLFGESEAAVRGLSVAAGVALVGLIYALAAFLSGRPAGLTAGFLAAISPYLVWYSQETRMYALLGALTAAGIYCLWRGLERGSAWWWLGYLAATIAACYTQIIGALLIPLHLLVVLVYLRSRRQQALRGLLAVGIAALCFAPLALIAWQSSGATSTERAVPKLAEAVASAPVMLLLRQVPAGWNVLAVPGVVLGVLGLAALFRRNRARALGLCIYLFGLLALIYAVSVWRLPIFGLPYIIVASAPALVAVALGVSSLWERRPAAGRAALAALALVSLVGLRYDWERSMGKEDWRAAAQYLSRYAAPGDVILAVPDYASIPLTYYYQGDVPVVAPFGGPVQPEAMEAALQGLAQARTIWLVWSHGEQIDPDGKIRQWLQRFPEMTEQWPRGVEVRALAPKYRSAAPDAPPLAAFGDCLHLMSADADQDVTARDQVYHPPSGWVHVRLDWQSSGCAALEGATAQVRVTDALGQVWGERLERPTETWRMYPPSDWLPGEVVRSEFDVNMNPATPAGRYRVEVQVLDKDGKPLAVTAPGMPGDRYFVSDVEVH